MMRIQYFITQLKLLLDSICYHVYQKLLSVELRTVLICTLPSSWNNLNFFEASDATAELDELGCATKTQGSQDTQHCKALRHALGFQGMLDSVAKQLCRRLGLEPPKFLGQLGPARGVGEMRGARNGKDLVRMDLQQFSLNFYRTPLLKFLFDVVSTCFHILFPLVSLQNLYVEGVTCPDLTQFVAFGSILVLEDLQRQHSQEASLGFEAGFEMLEFLRYFGVDQA